MNINENYSLSVNAPSIVDAKKLDRSFAPTDINGANDVNEVLSQLNVGEYSQESIDNVCKGYSLIRDDYGNPLSIVSSTYDLLQPIEAFGFLDTLQDELGFAYDKASFTNGGRKLNIFQWVLRSSQNQNATTAMSTVMTPTGDVIRLDVIFLPFVSVYYVLRPEAYRLNRCCPVNVVLPG